MTQGRARSASAPNGPGMVRRVKAAAKAVKRHSVTRVVRVVRGRKSSMAQEEPSSSSMRSAPDDAPADATGGADPAPNEVMAAPGATAAEADIGTRSLPELPVDAAVPPELSLPLSPTTPVGPTFDELGCATTVRPEWKLDSTVSECEGEACGHSAFTLVNRRHHCRVCGGIFCGRCSASHRHLLHLGYVLPQRVCKTCDARLDALPPPTAWAPYAALLGAPHPSPRTPSTVDSYITAHDTSKPGSPPSMPLASTPPFSTPHHSPPGTSLPVVASPTDATMPTAAAPAATTPTMTTPGAAEQHQGKLSAPVATSPANVRLLSELQRVAGDVNLISELGGNLARVSQDTRTLAASNAQRPLDAAHTPRRDANGAGIFSSFDPKSNRHDIYVSAAEPQAALGALWELVSQELVKHEKQPPPPPSSQANRSVRAQQTSRDERSARPSPWQFRSSAHAQFGKTLDDTLLSFLNWARTDDGDGGPMINVSKAFRRLRSFAKWMDEHEELLSTPPLTADSVRDVVRLLGVVVSHAQDGQLCVFVDVGLIDLAAFRSLSAEAVVRTTIWLAHAAMYDSGAQLHGVCLVYSIASIKFADAVTLLPIKTVLKLETLAIGILPLKLKAFLILDSPPWVSVIMRIVGVLMSKKLRKRIVTVGKAWHEPVARYGVAAIPRGFGECGGTFEGNLLDEHLGQASCSPRLS